MDAARRDRLLREADAQAARAAALAPGARGAAGAHDDVPVARADFLADAARSRETLLELAFEHCRRELLSLRSAA